MPSWPRERREQGTTRSDTARAYAQDDEPTGDWWIATAFRWNGGAQLLGPFLTRTLALTVRRYMEFHDKPRTYVVDRWPSDGTEPDE